MIQKLDLVVLMVVDWSASVEWYTRVLGLELVYKEDDDQWCQLRFPEGDTTLALHGGASSHTRTGNRCIPDIQVTDLAETVRELKRRGVEFLGEIRGGDEGFRIATFVDPEGNELQLYEWI